MARGRLSGMNRYKRLKEKGLCVHCQEKALPNRVNCQKCSEYHQKRIKKED